MRVLVFNSGSSSQKSCVYEIGETLPDEPPSPQWEGKIEWEGGHAKLRVRDAAGHERTDEVNNEDRQEATRRLLDALASAMQGFLKTNRR